MASDDRLVIQFAGLDAVVLIRPLLNLFEVDRSQLPRLFGPLQRLIPVGEGSLEKRLGTVQAVEIVLFPGGVIEVRDFLVVLAGPANMELYQLQIHVHHEQSPVAGPIGLVFDFGERVEGVGKVRFQRHLKPFYVFGNALRVLVELDVIELVKLLLVDKPVGLGIVGEEYKHKCDENGNTFHTHFIGVMSSCFQIRSDISCGDAVPSTM